jgi:hypothetical protein
MACGLPFPSHQFLHNVLVEDFRHGRGDDDIAAALEEGFAFRFMVLAKLFSPCR